MPRVGCGRGLCRGGHAVRRGVRQTCSSSRGVLLGLCLLCMAAGHAWMTLQLLWIAVLGGVAHRAMASRPLCPARVRRRAVRLVLSMRHQLRYRTRAVPVTNTVRVVVLLLLLLLLVRSPLRTTD